MRILFDGKLDSLFNLSVCAQPKPDDKQMLVIGFGYSASQVTHLNIPLPPGNNLLLLSTLPGTFFTALEKSFSPDASTSAVLYRHRLEFLDACDTNWSEHEQGVRNVKNRYLSFELPIGEHRFGPVGLTFAAPKPNTVWLPCTADHSQRSYVVGVNGLRPVGQWTRSGHQLAIHTSASEVGNSLDLSEYAYRCNGQPPAVVEFTSTKPRQGI